MSERAERIGARARGHLHPGRGTSMVLTLPAQLTVAAHAAPPVPWRCRTDPLEHALPERIRILVVDDHTLFRRGLIALLSREPQFEVVGDAADAGEAQRRAQELQPDLILLDNHLPGVRGVDALPALREAAPGPAC